MTDIIYNAITRPIPSEPDKIDGYHLRKVSKDAKVKRIDDQEPHSNQQNTKQDEKADEDEVIENKELSASNINEQEAAQKGKGKFKDDDGVEHLDIYI